MAVNWELQGCCGHNQRIFIAAVGVSTVVILLVSADLPVADALSGCFGSPRDSGRRRGGF
jgi:hypothetical protein